MVVLSVKMYFIHCRLFLVKKSWELHEQTRIAIITKHRQFKGPETEDLRNLWRPLDFYFNFLIIIEEPYKKWYPNLIP